MLTLVLLLQVFISNDTHAYTIRDAGNGRIEIFCGNRLPPSIADNYPSSITNMHQVGVFVRANCKEAPVANPVFVGGGASKDIKNKLNNKK